jgi:hypothetical protein
MTKLQSNTNTFLKRDVPAEPWPEAEPAQHLVAASNAGCFGERVVEKAAWKCGGLRMTQFEPFEMLRRSNRESYRKEQEEGGSGCDLAIWLPTVDTFRTFASQNCVSRTCEAPCG